MALEETTILVSDLEEVRYILAACQTYFVARDLQQAQVEFRASRPAPITQEIERIRERFDAYLGDFLLRQHEDALAEDREVVEEDAEGAEDGSEDVTEASEEELSGSPLGEFKAPKQKGRRLSADEV